jgi:pimeloyl-ACP methyl ester carboxylesterase
MGVGAKIGIAAVAIIIIAGLAVVVYGWKHPLALYAMVNRRALSNAGLKEATAETGFGLQSYWSGGQGPTLVLLHGAGDQSGTWASTIEPLVPRYRVVIPDLAGHGASAPRDGTISVEQILRGVEAILSTGPQDPVILVGNSLGAWVALLYAHDHPDRVARVVLVNGGALRGDRPDLSMTPKTREEAAALMKQLRDEKAAPIKDYVLDDIVRAAQTGPLSRLVQTVGEMDRYLLDGKLGEIAAPVNLLWGESDQLLSLDYARRMMSQFRASRLTTLPGCGHVPHQECPSRFRAALLDILQQAPPTPAAADGAGPGSHASR